MNQIPLWHPAATYIYAAQLWSQSKGLVIPFTQAPKIIKLTPIYPKLYTRKERILTFVCEPATCTRVVSIDPLSAME